jgi:hypothetical protein
VHISLRHASGASRFKCPSCSACFTSSVVFFRHLDSRCSFPGENGRNHLLMTASCGTALQKNHLEFLDAFFVIGQKRVHQCKVCLRCYERMSTLQSHYADFPCHSNADHLECYFCSQAMIDKEKIDLYMLHLATHLDKEQPFECKNCHSSFDSMSSLRRHARIDSHC